MRVLTLTIAQALVAAACLTPGMLPAQTTTPSADWKLPRTVDGHPDFAGVWANNNATPLERPKELEGRDRLTDAEVEAMKRRAAELFDGTGDAAFGDEVFRTVFASLNGIEHRPSRKGREGLRRGHRATTARCGPWPETGTTGRRWSPILPTARFRR